MGMYKHQSVPAWSYVNINRVKINHYEAWYLQDGGLQSYDSCDLVDMCQRSKRTCYLYSNLLPLCLRQQIPPVNV